MSFTNLIKGMAEQTSKNVVIFIDEYDKPVLDALYTEYEEQNRQELCSFYSPLKDFEKENRFYTLDFPNREVEEGFLEVLL